MHGSLEMQGSLISIHASAKEATQTKSAATTAAKFQSTPPRRRRPPQQMQQQSNPDISIHASAKEATRLQLLKLRNLYYFNPRLREGGDGMLMCNPYYGLFQSTPPRRRRPVTMFLPSENQLFQSTPPRRRRPQHIVIPQLSCTYLVSTTFLSTIFSFISQYVVLFFLF